MASLIAVAWASANALTPTSVCFQRAQRGDADIGGTAGALIVGEPDQSGGGVSITGALPCRGTGLAFGVELVQPTAGALPILGGVEAVSV